MAQKINLPFPVWEGMNRIANISEVVISLCPKIKIPHGYPRSIELQHLMIRGIEETYMDAHVEVKFWFPKQGTVRIEMIGQGDKTGLSFRIIKLTAKWKDGHTKNSILLEKSHIEKIGELIYCRRNHNFGMAWPGVVSQLEKETTKMLLEVPISISEIEAEEAKNPHYRNGKKTL
ncbi:MAG: hypothetical protein WC468_03825 [Candidatus Paceibacterota bacterium]